MGDARACAYLLGASEERAHKHQQKVVADPRMRYDRRASALWPPPATRVTCDRAASWADARCAHVSAALPLHLTIACPRVSRTAAAGRQADRARYDVMVHHRLGRRHHRSGLARAGAVESISVRPLEQDAVETTDETTYGTERVIDGSVLTIASGLALAGASESCCAALVGVWSRVSSLCRTNRTIHGSSRYIT